MTIIGAPSDSRVFWAAGSIDQVLTAILYRCGLRAWQLQIMSLSAVGLCVGLWIRAKTVDQDERGNAERRALFVGLWPPTIWLIGDSLARHEVIPGARLRTKLMRRRRIFT